MLCLFHIMRNIKTQANAIRGFYVDELNKEISINEKTQKNESRR